MILNSLSASNFCKDSSNDPSGKISSNVAMPLIKLKRNVSVCCRVLANYIYKNNCNIFSNNKT